MPFRHNFGAGDGNRTRILGLENQYNNRYTTPADLGGLIITISWLLDEI